MLFMEGLLILIFGFAGGSYVAQSQAETQGKETLSPYGSANPNFTGERKSEILQLMEACSNICGRDRVKEFDIKFGDCKCIDHKE